MNNNWAKKNVLITGGMGFIGSNLAIRLVNAGAKVTLVDAMIPEYGGNPFNVAAIRDRIEIHYGDICDRHAMNWLVQDRDVVFHLAGQVSHVMSMSDPFPDIEFNIKGTVVLMEALRRVSNPARVVFTGTRGQYGPARSIPVNEEAPTHPKALYEISNLTAEKIILAYREQHHIPAVALRLTNVYGPRAQMRHSQYGVANWFIRQAVDGETIRVFGDGQILRDFLYVDDCIDALLKAGLDPLADGEIFNVGVDSATSFLELAEILVKLCPQSNWEFAPFSPERKAQEPGDYFSDISKIRRLLGWQPRTQLEDGLAQSIAYYRVNRGHYWQSTPVRTRRKINA